MGKYVNNMKSIIFSAIFFFLFVSARAQYFCDDYTRMYAGMAFGSLENRPNKESFGFQMGALYAHNLTNNKKPLFLQLGMDLNYVSKEFEEEDETLTSLSFPINLSYKFKMTDDCSFEPFFGVNFRYNITAKATSKVYYVGVGKQKLDYFKDLDAKRFQFGLNVGASFNFDCFNIGYRFCPDLTNFFGKEYYQVDTRTRYHFVTFGLTL